MVLLAVCLCLSAATPAMFPEAPPNQPALLLTTNHYPEGIASEGEYLRWLDEQHAILERTLTNAPASATTAWSAHVGNWILADRCEPHLTRLLLGIETDQDTKTLTRLSAQALAQLQSARDHWPAGDDQNLERLEMLILLARSVSAVAGSRAGQGNREALMDLAGELAIWTDDEDLDIAGFALLYQSLAYLETRQFRQARGALPLSLEPVRQRALDFFLRLLRCKVLVEEERQTLARALILKMEERCTEWFTDQAKQHAAQCTLTWLRIQLTQSLHDDLRSTTAGLQKSLLARAQAFLLDEEAPCQFARLTRAAPMLFSKPAQQDSPVRQDPQPSMKEEPPASAPQLPQPDVPKENG